MRFISNRGNFGVACEPRRAVVEGLADAPHLSDLVRSQTILALVTGDVREEHVGGGVLLLFRKITQLLYSLIE